MTPDEYKAMMAGRRGASSTSSSGSGGSTPGTPAAGGSGDGDGRTDRAMRSGSRSSPFESFSSRTPNAGRAEIMGGSARLAGGLGGGGGAGSLSSIQDFAKRMDGPEGQALAKTMATSRSKMERARTDRRNAASGRMSEVRSKVETRAKEWAASDEGQAAIARAKEKIAANPKVVQAKERAASDEGQAAIAQAKARYEEFRESKGSDSSSDRRRRFYGDKDGSQRVTKH